MKKLGVILLLFMVCFCATGATLLFGAETEYDVVARNFLKYLNSDKKIISANILEANSLDPAGTNVPVAYLVNLEKGGYILISASKSLTPVKAYSLISDFDTLPPAYRLFLLSEAEYNIRTINSSARIEQSIAISRAQKSWDFLLNPDQYRVPYEYTPDSFLLTTRWDQGYPYNRFLPEIGGERVVAGCTNVAMAQLMKYHNYPATGYGVESHAWNSQVLKTIMCRPYNWGNMPDVLNGAQPEYQADEVALLIRDLGIANHTEFGIDGSGAAININTLVENFGYAGTIKILDNSDVELFFNTIAEEINALRPLLLRFPGHFTVADGYGSDPTGRKIHVNFGWGGHYNDYYFLDQVVEAGGYTFSPDLDIYYDIKPCSVPDSDCFINLETEDSIEGLSISGRFNYDRDSDRYEVYLKGDTNIVGDRGYSNQAFHLSLYDTDYNPVAGPSADPLSLPDLSPGRYTIKASLWGDSWGYTYDSMLNYTVTVNTNDLTQAEKDAVDATLDKAPIIGNDFVDVVLNNSVSEPYQVLVDARDENGDSVSLSLTTSNAAAVQAGFTDNVLAISPAAGALNVASRITITAFANGKTTEKSFVVMVSDEDVAFGKSFEVSGIFENQEDFNTHKVILDGNYTITGLNGFSNQAFYSSVLDADQVTVADPGDTAISGLTGGPGIYFLGASLKEYPSGYGSFYEYKPGENDVYVFIVNCPDADVRTTTIAQMLGIDLSGLIVSVRGDFDQNGSVDLADAILALKIISGMVVSGEDISLKADVDGDGRIGLADELYILQRAAGLGD